MLPLIKKLGILADDSSSSSSEGVDGSAGTADFTKGAVFSKEKVRWGTTIISYLYVIDKECKINQRIYLNLNDHRSV